MLYLRKFSEFYRVIISPSPSYILQKIKRVKKEKEIKIIVTPSYIAFHDSRVGKLQKESK